MTPRREILIQMLEIAVGILVAKLIWSSEGMKSLCIYYVTPVAVVSNFVWFEPEMEEKLF
jgi:hypothetical protein